MLQTEQAQIAYDKPMIWANLIMASMDDPHPMKGMFNSAIATQQMYGEWLITEDSEGVRVDAMACQQGEGVFHIQNSDKNGHEGTLPRISQWASTLQEAVTELNRHCEVMNEQTGLDDDVIKTAIHEASCNLMFNR